MLRRPLLLLIDALGLEACQMHDETPVWLAGFASGEAAALNAWLATRAPRERCRILVNLADETYQTEDLPRVRGADRRALIARRTAAWFPHPEFARAWSLGAAPDGRKGFERLVFAGLERPDELRPWLEALRASGARITHLIPAANLIPAVLTATSGRRVAETGPLLVAGFSRGGLRISLVDRSGLQFSRLVGHCTLAAAAHSGAWLDEIERTRDYLRSQRRLPHTGTVPVRVLESAESLPLTSSSRAGLSSDVESALSFLPAASTTVQRSAQREHHATHATLDTLLVRALRRAPGDLGWKPAIIRSSTLTPTPRTLALAGLIASTALGSGAWYVAREAGAAQDAERAARTPEALPATDNTPWAAIEPVVPDSPAQAPCPAPEAPPPASNQAAQAAPAPAPQRIDGILVRPDGQAFVWLDGQLVSAREAGLQAAIGTEPALSPARIRHQRLRVGDLWAGPQQQAVAAQPSTAASPPEPATDAADAVPSPQGPIREARP